MDDWKLINRGALRTKCQSGFYLAWRLIDPAAGAKLFVCETSNLPPSKEGGEGDGGREIQMDA